MFAQEIHLTSGDAIKPGLFNVFIGGNGVGKTTLLIELFAKMTDAQRARWHWVRDVKFASNDYAKDAKLLRGSLARKWDGANIYYYSQAAKDSSGNVTLDGSLRLSQAEVDSLDTALSPDGQGKLPPLFSGLKYRRPFVSLLDCETRLNLGNQSNVVQLDQPPQDPLNVLNRNKHLLRQISEALKSQFGSELHLLDHKQTVLDLGLSEEAPPPFDRTADDLQNEFEKVERWRTGKLTPINEVGHGIRSMLRILISLLDPVNQVFLIDEPEMHLYPSQKRWIGRQLEQLAREQNKQVFLVTHDPMVLQGILDARSSTSIFRLSFDGPRSRKLQSCVLDHVADVGATRNQDSYLQGLFYQRCIAVEGATDRAFYQTMAEDYSEVSDKDLGFVVCGGKGSSKHVASIAKQVGLPCALLYDFDVMLTNLGVLEGVFSTLGGDDSGLAPLKDFMSLFGDEREISKNQRVKEAAKRGVQSDLVQSNLALFEETMEKLRQVGIFVVPHGDLESWAPTVEPKIRFPELAPDIVKDTQELKERLDKFLRSILAFLKC